MAQRKSGIQKSLEKNFDMKAVMMVAVALFVIWFAFLGWDYISSNADINAALIQPIMEADLLVFGVVVVLFLALIGYIAKRKKLTKKR